jgi:hypothetical protein
LGSHTAARGRLLCRARDDIGGCHIATIATLVVDVVADTKKLNAGLTSAQGGISKFGALAGVGFAVAGAAVIKFGADVVGAASDLNESVNKTKVVFGDQAQGVMDWAKTTADSFGISEQAALESASTMGNLFDAMGLIPTVGADMSMTLVELAADLASFNNADPSDVLQAMQSGLTGQIRPLRQYGIEISDAALQQEALAEGIDKSTSEMTMAEKVQLRYALILKQTGNAQGDFARTSDDLANMQRRLNAQWQDLQAQLGKALLPTVLSLVSALNDLATVILFLTGASEGWNEKTKEAAANTATWELGIADFFARAVNGIPIIGDLVDTTHLVGVAMDEAGKGIQLTGDQLNMLANNIRGQSTAWEGLRDHWVGVANDFLGFAQDVPQHVSKIEHAMTKIPKAFRDTAQALVDEIPAIRGTVTTWKDTFTLSPGEFVKITQSWARIAKTIASDLKEIGESDLKPRMREAIAALPPEMAHAWAEGNAKQRGAIERSIQTTFNVADQMPGLAKQALQGSTAVGQSVDQGIINGINAGAPFIQAAATRAVQRAIEAARTAADAHSPSRKMRELGQDLMEGLKDGIGDKDREVAQKLTDSISKMLDAAKSALSDFRSKMKDFAGGISGGFSSFSDLVGGFGKGEEPLGIQDFLASQLAGAQGFADVLDALKRQGASKGLLSQIAGAGPEGLGFAQALLQGGPELVAQASQQLAAINEIAHHEGGVLSKDFFGAKMDRLQERADRIKDLLAEANRLQSGKGGDIILQLDGQVLARVTRNELLKLGARNAGTGL